MDYLSAAWTAIYYTAYPIFYILNLILFVLAIITAPLLHLGHHCFYACWHALHVLGKFEASQAKLDVVDTCFTGHSLGQCRLSTSSSESQRLSASSLAQAFTMSWASSYPYWTLTPRLKSKKGVPWLLIAQRSKRDGMRRIQLWDWGRRKVFRRMTLAWGRSVWTGTHQNRTEDGAGIESIPFLKRKIAQIASDSEASMLDLSKLPTPKSPSQVTNRGHLQILPTIVTLELSLSHRHAVQT